MTEQHIKKTLPLIVNLHPIKLRARLMRGELLPDEAILARCLLHFRNWKRAEAQEKV